MLTLQMVGAAYGRPLIARSAENVLIWGTGNMIKPSLFNTDMVRAILAGRKTATRRVVRPMCSVDMPHSAKFFVSTRSGVVYWDGIDRQLTIDGKLVVSPYRPGGILYVRETWGLYHQEPGFYVYRADHHTGTEFDGFKWRPSIHMPREAARIFLRVTDVRAERLFDSFTAQGDTIAAIRDEGIDIGEHCRQCIENYGNPCCNDLDPELEPDENGEDENGGSECGILDEVRGKFADLWDRCYAAPRPVKGNGGVIDHYESYPWADINETRTYKGKPWYVMGNPWVWVTEFERVDREEALKNA